MEVIQTATKSGAEILKIDQITGTLEKDKFADLIVLNRDPSKDITVISGAANMNVIMKKGAF